MRQNDKLYDLFLSTLDTQIACPYCGEPNQLDPALLCCGEVHAEEFYLIDDDLVEMRPGRALNRAFESWLNTRETVEPQNDTDKYFSAYKDIKD